MNARNTTIDTAKGLGIIFVVLGHSWLVGPNRLMCNDKLFKIIFSFHMPLFFFLSGIFLKREESIHRFTATKFASLLKPYFFVLIIFGISELSSSAINHREFDICDYLFGLMWGTGEMLSWAWRPLWFLPHLFLTLVFSLLIIKLVLWLQQYDIVILAVSLVLLIAGVYTISAFWSPNQINLNAIGNGKYPGLPWSIDLIPITAAFVLSGYSFRECVKSAKPSHSWFLVAISAFFLLHYLFDETINLNLRQYGNPLITTTQAALGIFIIISVAAMMQSSKTLSTVFSYLGSASLFILLFHEYFQAMIFQKILDTTDGNEYYIACFSLVACIILSCVIFEIAQRYKYIGYMLLPKKSNKNPPVAQADA